MQNYQYQAVPVADHYVKASADLPLVEVQKTFETTRGAVWGALTSPDLIKEWWGPEGIDCPFASFEPVKGGKFLFCMEGQGKKIWSTGSIVEFEPELLLVLSNFPSNPKGEALPPSSEYDGPFPDDGESYISIELSGTGTLTLMKLCHSGLPAHMHDECVDGWSSSLDKLKALLEKH